MDWGRLKNGQGLRAGKLPVPLNLLSIPKYEWESTQTTQHYQEIWAEIHQADLPIWSWATWQYIEHFHTIYYLFSYIYRFDILFYLWCDSNRPLSFRSASFSCLCWARCHSVLPRIPLITTTTQHNHTPAVFVRGCALPHKPYLLTLKFSLQTFHC